MKKPAVTIKNYFPPRGMTPDYLAELATIGRGIAEDMEAPATLRRDCLRVAMASDDCTRLLQADPLALLDAGFRLGRALETVSRNQAIVATLERMQQRATNAILAAGAPRPKSRKTPPLEVLQAFIQAQPNWDVSNPQPRGCIKAAARHFGVDEKTIRITLKQ
jgi:hypothetical protein